MFELIAESQDIFENTGFQVDYDKEKGIFRISYFENNHFVDECFFDKEVFEV